MFKRILTAFIFSLFFLSIAFASSDDESMPDQVLPRLFSFSGYVDSSYNYLLRSNQFTSGNFNRSNDIEANGLTLQQTGFLFSAHPSQGWGGAFNFIVGRDANSLSPKGMNPDFFDSQSTNVALRQAYIEYNSLNNIIKGGELLSLSGIESFNPTKNTNFSRSIIDQYAQAGVHVGLRDIYKTNRDWHFIIGTGNGWSTVRQAADQNSLELGISNAETARFSWMLDTYYTNKQYITSNANSGPSSSRKLIDFFGTFSITEKLSLAANYDYNEQPSAALPNGSISRANWQGLAGYINYLINNHWKTSFRTEIFSDPQGYATGVRQYWREATLTLGYVVNQALEFRAETRHDLSNKNSFVDKNGITNSNNQQSYALEMLYQF